jgi:Double zinc ribbon
MDNIERMYRHLVRTIRARFPQHLVQPFDVASLHQTILPYRHHRRELGLETNEDYEITLLELLSGARGYLIVDEQMRDVLTRELASRNPDPATFRQFAETQIALSPESLRRLDAGPSPTGQFATVAAPSPVAPGSPPVSAQPLPPPVDAGEQISANSAQKAGIIPREGACCAACDESLPLGRPITFCPHCGQNLTITNCSACGTELELDWRFCPVCGKPASR